MIKHFAKYIPNELKDMSGSVFYSGENGFKGKKALYILGLNPGGSDIAQKSETIEWHTQNLLKNESRDFSEYKDGQWRGKEKGTYGLQPRVLHLIDSLGLNPYEIPASNVCFVRSPRESDIADKLKGYMDLCWVFHQQVIDQLGIKTILCFGKTAGKYVKKQLGANVLIDEFVERNNRKWRTQVFRNKLEQNVIIASHPSIADWTNEKTDISDLVKKYV